MKQTLALILICLVGCEFAHAQQSGAQALRLAQSIYEQGRLHELPGLEGLKDAKIATYSKSEQVNAYRLLTLAHIYLEEPEEADKTMLKLLNADHFYEPKDNVEPAEFMGLYKTFRTKAVFNFGLKFGANSTIPALSGLYYVSNYAPGNGKYAPKVGIQVGLVFEKELFDKPKNSRLIRRIIFAPEVMYTSRTFSYANSEIFKNDSTLKSAAEQTVTIKQTWLDINPVFQLKLRNSINFVPYVGLGPGVSIMLNASNAMIDSRKNVVGAVIGPDVPTTSSYRTIIPSVIGSAGLKYRFGEFYVTAEFRVQYALISPINPSKRTVSTSVFDYNYTPPNYKPINLVANIGFVFPYFNPIKLKRK